MNEICSEKMIIYSILGKVDQENDKLYYLKNWQKIFPIIDELIKDLPYKKIWSSQSFVKFLKLSKDGQFFHVTSRKASTGGKMNWNLKNFQKVATKNLTKNDHLVFAFENSQYEMNKKYFKKGRELVDIHKHQIQASLDEEPKKKLDFIFKIMPDWHSKGGHNQYVNIFISETMLNSIGDKKIIKAIEDIYSIMSGTKIGYTSRNWSYLVGGGFDLITLKDYNADSNLNFYEHEFGKWEVHNIGANNI